MDDWMVKVTKDFWVHFLSLHNNWTRDLRGGDLDAMPLMQSTICKQWKIQDLWFCTTRLC